MVRTSATRPPPASARTTPSGKRPAGRGRGAAAGGGAFSEAGADLAKAREGLGPQAGRVRQELVAARPRGEAAVDRLLDQHGPRHGWSAGGSSGNWKSELKTRWPLGTRKVPLSRS